MPQSPAYSPYRGYCPYRDVKVFEIEPPDGTCARGFGVSSHHAYWQNFRRDKDKIEALSPPGYDLGIGRRCPGENQSGNGTRSARGFCHPEATIILGT